MNKYTIGVDVGGTNLKLGLINSSGKIVARSRLNTKTFIRSKGKLINAIVEEIYTLIKKKNLTKKQILGVGLGLPGFIDPQKGLIHYLPNIPGWKNVPIKRILKQKLKMPVFIDNDVNLITLAEWKKGAGKGYSDLVCITLGTGFGGGLVLDGKLYHGSNSAAGEIGHIPYLRKTIEGYVGNKTLSSKANRIFRKKGMQPRDVGNLARKGNKKAHIFWQEVGSHVGYVLAGVTNVLNPGLIIIGGGVSNNIKFFGPALKASIKRHAISVSSRVKIVRAKLGDDAGILGAHFLVKDSIIGK